MSAKSAQGRWPNRNALHGMSALQLQDIGLAREGERVRRLIVEPEEAEGRDMTTESSSRSPLEVIHQCIEHLNTNELDEAAKLIAPGAINHAAEGNETGPEVFLGAWKALKTAFPDWNFTIIEAVATENRVMCRYENRGTQHGEFAGHPATGKTFVSLGLDCVHVEDGLVMEHWALLDLADMGKQLGWADGPS